MTDLAIVLSVLFCSAVMGGLIALVKDSLDI